ncbi:Rha family transcriptional regulator [Burkholderia stagnalis]|uniref:Rha family transcriptional regulator n=1 Tax=Burkholderia stagnalis TaxID=1503054 RepID=UPI000F5C275D|nr:Rha family transcriptional regulator [Burkholderia stagnalis]RQP98063.1 hypothetical protein DF164_31695 [Burkholderia stagnalis]RQY68851.1 hypothetical protein DF110_18615 [Burkholderia stagnalis]
MDIVAVDGEPRASSEIIANGVEVQHKNVLELLRRHFGSFEEFGKVTFQTRLNRRGSATEFAMLNEQTTPLLLAVMRNTPPITKQRRLSSHP